jgi:putative transposase
MARKKKHSTAEIAAKLAHADELEKQGKLQSEIARTLAVSVMTLHRWRKTPPGSFSAPEETDDIDQSDRSYDRKISDLQLENLRLRRLVTDLLLEKMKLEEAAQAARSLRYGPRQGSRK